MSTAKCKQFQRENLLLRSQLEQLLQYDLLYINHFTIYLKTISIFSKDFKDQNPISSSSARAEENIWVSQTI